MDIDAEASSQKNSKLEEEFPEEDLGIIPIFDDFDHDTEALFIEEEFVKDEGNDHAGRTRAHLEAIFHSCFSSPTKLCLWFFYSL